MPNEQGGDSSVMSGGAVSEIELGPAWGGVLPMVLTSAPIDEFVRAGDTIRLSLPGWILWDRLHPDQGAQEVARLAQLDATVSVLCDDAQGATVTLSAAKVATSGDEPYLFRLITAPVVVPQAADRLRFAITASDSAEPGATAQFDAGEIASVPVFGGALPDKQLLFDTRDGVFRQRTLPGGAPVAGGAITIAYTDWRADTLVDRMMIDTQIGRASYAGRFGWTTVPVHGRLVHEVSYGIYFDDGQGWRPEQELVANNASRVLPAYRTAYEATISAPPGATRMSIYVHVRTYLIADYSGYAQVTEKWYADGARVLTRERWDNPYGPFTNYDYDLEH